MSRRAVQARQLLPNREIHALFAPRHANGIDPHAASGRFHNYVVSFISFLTQI
jgi:hypothetical protein